MIAATLVFLGLSISSAAPKTTHFFPSAVTRGTFPVLVQAEGDSGSEPKIWSDDKNLAVTPGPKSGQFLIEAKAQCRTGWHIVRLHNSEGVTNPIPVWVDDLANFAEAEPNNSVSESHSVIIPPSGGTTHIHGRLEKSGDVDGFRVFVPANRTLVARLEANRHLESPMDATLQIVDSKGFVLAHNDDSRGFDPELTFTVSEPTEVIVRLFAFPSTPNSTIGFSGASNYIYRLTLSTGPTMDHLHNVAFHSGETLHKPVGWNLADNSFPRFSDQSHDYSVANYLGSDPVLVPKSEFGIVTLVQGENPKISKFPLLVTGTIESENTVHQFQIAAKKDDTYQLRVFSKLWESQLDPVLIVRDSSSKKLLEIDDSSNNSRDLEAIWKAPSDGLFQFEIKDLHGRGGVRMFYGIECTQDGIPAEILFSPTSQTVKPGEKLELTLSYDKRSDLQEPLNIQFQGLPKGFPEIKPVEPSADSKTDSTKKSSGRRRSGSSSAGMNSLKYLVELSAEQSKAIGPWSGPVEIIAKDSTGKAIPIQYGGNRGARLGLNHVWFHLPPNVEKKTEEKKPEKKS